MPSLSGCGADALSQDLFTTLAADAAVAVTPPDLSDPIYQLPDQSGPVYALPEALTNAALTGGTVDGEGTFDIVMRSLKGHLQQEFDKGRINGDQYAKSYIELTSVALQTAVQFLLGRDTARWQAILAQSQAKTAQIGVVQAAVELATAKTQFGMVTAQMQNARAEYSLTKLQLANLDVDYCIKLAQKTAAQYQNTDILPAQKVLIQEQAEAQRAQTLDTRSDGVTSVAGSVGKQKALYTQQIDSFQKDAQYKAGKMYLDAWITQKSLDEGLLAPTELQNAMINTVLTKIRTDNGLV